MNWIVKRSNIKHQNQKQIGILIESDLFIRGLREALKEMASFPWQVRVLTPSVAINDIQAGALDALILDTDSAPKLAHVLETYDQHPKVILVSCRYHAGVSLPLPKERVCCFYSARSTEWEMKHYRNVVMPCNVKKPERMNCEACPIHRSLQPRSLPLTDRESEILKLIGLLHKSSDIARQLDISVKTVEAHCTNIKRKLNLDNSRELLQEAVRWVEGL